MINQESILFDAAIIELNQQNIILQVMVPMIFHRCASFILKVFFQKCIYAIKFLGIAWHFYFIKKNHFLLARLKTTCDVLHRSSSQNQYPQNILIPPQLFVLHTIPYHQHPVPLAETLFKVLFHHQCCHGHSSWEYSCYLWLISLALVWVCLQSFANKDKTIRLLSAANIMMLNNWIIFNQYK